MLSTTEWSAYCDQHGLPQEMRQYLDEVRTDGPSRVVGDYAKGAVSVWHASKKMRGTVQSESWTAESYYLYELEYDDSILEYYPQPPPVSVYRTTRQGTTQRGYHTPDVVVIPTGRPPYVVEVKPVSKVQKYLKDQHPDWLRDGGDYQYKPAREAFRAIGMDHRVIAVSKARRVRTANLAILIQARACPAEYDDALRRRAANVLAGPAWCSLATLKNELELSTYTPIIQMIAVKILHADIDDQLLSDPRSAIVASSEKVLDVWRNLAKLNDERAVCTEQSEVDVEAVPSLKDVEQALKNLERVRRNDSSRHTRRLKARLKEGHAKGLSDFQALVGKYHKSGNRRGKLPKRVREFLQEFLAEEWASPRRLTQRAAYTMYCVRARESHPGHAPCGRTTFSRAIRSLDAETTARGRGGRRAAAAARPPTPMDERAIRSILPYQVAAADHYNVDVHTVIFDRGKTRYTARLWLTILKDVYSGHILGRYLSLNSPSRIACAMVMRDCVRRNQRLPAMIVVDHGAEFRSEYFRGLMADLGIDLAFRPSGEPRYGSEAERIFGEFRSQWLPYVDGNTVERSEARSVSGSHHPQNTAILRPDEFLEQLDAYLEWRGTVLHGSAMQTPEDAYRSKASAYDFVGRVQSIDRHFLIKTAVDVRKYSVDPQRGIHTGGDLHFWAPDLQSVEKKSQVEVRVDPERPYEVYARVGGKWITCQAPQSTQFWNQTPRDREVEALRWHGAGPLRAQARQDAHEELVKKQSDVDRGNDHDRLLIQEGCDEAPTPLSVFDAVRNSSSEAVSIETWEDS